MGFGGHVTVQKKKRQVMDEPLVKELEVLWITLKTLVFAKLGVFSPGVTSGGEMLLRLATFGIREFGCEQTGVETH